MFQRLRSSHRPIGLLTIVSLGAFTLLLALSVGTSVADDVSSAEARGQLGMDAAQPETPVTAGPRLSAQGSQDAPWLETTAYLVVASLIFAGYALAARKVPWLRPRRQRKP
ncbi:MAG: hypothetical protein ACE5JE_01845 [Thermoplasmata archaeon]